MQRAEFKLETLTCPSCAVEIEDMLRATEGVKSVFMMFQLSTVKTEYDKEKVSAEQLEKSIIDLGYSVVSKRVS